MSDSKGFATLHITDATEDFEIFDKLQTGRLPIESPIPLLKTLNGEGPRVEL
jgi:hypothetical protein